MLHGRAVAQRFLYMFGGCTELWSNMSAEAEMFAVHMTYGAKAEYKSAGREPTDYPNSKLIVMWGWSPGDGTFGTGTFQYLKWAKKQGVRIVCVDPRRTKSSLELADEHVFIRPSTDAAALIAMAYVIVDRGAAGPGLLRPPRARLGRGAPAAGRARRRLVSLVPARPRRWRAQDAGVGGGDHRHAGRDHPPARHRVRHAKPAALHCGYAPGRTAYGEQFHRAAYALAAITGNVGHPRRQLGHEQRRHRPRGAIRMLPTGANPDRRARGLAAPRRPPGARHGRAAIPADIKLIYSVAGDLFNQAPNVNKTVAALDGVEFFVAQDHFLTPTARYADVVLPATTFWERNDIHTPWAGAGHYTIFMKQAIEPTCECRNDIDIFADLARRVGDRGLQRPDRDGMAARADEGRGSTTSTPSASGASRGCPRPEDAVAFARQIREPEGIRSRRRPGRSRSTPRVLAAKPDPYGLGAIPPIPTWIPPLTPDPRYPLQLCTPKSRARTHSVHGNQEILSRADRDDVWLNPTTPPRAASPTAQRVARVQRPRGDRDRRQGHRSASRRAWCRSRRARGSRPTPSGADVSGCANVLTEDRSAPCGATTYNTCLVQVERAS